MKNDTTAALDVEPELSKADAEANRLPLLARRRVSAINKKVHLRRQTLAQTRQTLAESLADGGEAPEERSVEAGILRLWRHRVLDARSW